MGKIIPDSERIAEELARSERITSEDVTRYCVALMTDVAAGRITPAHANAESRRIGQGLARVQASIRAGKIAKRGTTTTKGG